MLFDPSATDGYGVNGMGELPPAGASDRQKLVYGLYQTYLGRDPEQGAINYWANQSLSDADIVKAISQSPEAKARVTPAPVVNTNTTGAGASGNTSSLPIVNNVLDSMPSTIFGMSPMVAVGVGVAGLFLASKMLKGR